MGACANEEIAEVFGKWLRDSRRSAGLTENQLGALSGISGQSIARYEKGLRYPSIARVELLGRILGKEFHYKQGQKYQILPNKDEMYGSYLRRVRKSQNISMQDLAEKCNYSYQVIARIESNVTKFSTDKIKPIFTELNLDIEDFTFLTMRYGTIITYANTHKETSREKKISQISNYLNALSEKEIDAICILLHIKEQDNESI